MADGFAQGTRKTPELEDTIDCLGARGAEGIEFPRRDEGGSRLAGDAGVNLWSNPVPWVALVLACLGVLMALEALRIVLAGLRRPPATKGAPVLGTTG